jgi:hypothetical protein
MIPTRIIAAAIIVRDIETYLIDNTLKQTDNQSDIDCLPVVQYT